MPDGGEDDSGMPLGAVAKRLGVEGYLHKKRRPKDSKSGCSRASEERSFHRKRRTEMPDGVFDDIGMPLGAVAKRLGVRGISTKKRRPNGRLYFVEIVGVEPTTLCLQSRCSSQLSYTPFLFFSSVCGVGFARQSVITIR